MRCSSALFLLALLVIQLPATSSEGIDSIFVKVSHHRSQIRRSFAFQHGGFVDRIDDIRLLGSAAVMADGSIRIPAPLGKNSSNQAGRALFASPVRMWDPNTSLPASFETHFSFSIGGEGTKSSSVVDDDGDDVVLEAAGGGLAFVIVPDEITVGRDAGFLGMLNEVPLVGALDEGARAGSPAPSPSPNLCHKRSTGSKHPVIAVEFDAFRDEAFDDPNDNHVGVNLGTMVSHRTADLSSIGVFLKSGSSVRAHVAYDGISQQLRVQVEGDNAPQPLILDIPLDLTAFLREYMFVGFSASTGTRARTHSIHNWTFSCASAAVQRFPTDLTPGAGSCDEAALEHEVAQSTKTKHPPRAFLLFLAASGTAIFAILSAFIAWPWVAAARRRQRKPTTTVAPPLITPRPRPLHRPRKLELHEITMATGNFDDKHRIGEGSLGVVFRGTLQDGSLVAVKRFHQHCHHRRLGFIEVKAAAAAAALEQRILAATELRHSNLVPVRGWCHGRDHMMLAYDYMPNGSLDKWLYPEFAVATLPWSYRWKAAMGAARGAAYLHRCGFIHGRLKSSNILFDITFDARVGDFGFECGRGTHDTSDDIFGFGAVCLELVCGVPLLDVHGKSLLEPIRSIQQLQLPEGEALAEAMKAVDSRLSSNYDAEQAASLLRVGLMCTRPEPKARPAMEGAVEGLVIDLDRSMR